MQTLTSRPLLAGERVHHGGAGAERAAGTFRAWQPTGSLATLREAYGNMSHARLHGFRSAMRFAASSRPSPSQLTPATISGERNERHTQCLGPPACCFLVPSSLPTCCRLARYTANPVEATNEIDPSTRLLHALGAWRVGIGFHDVVCRALLVLRVLTLLRLPRLPRLFDAAVGAVAGDGQLLLPMLLFAVGNVLLLLL